MHAFLSNLANRQTDRQTDKHGQQHVPAPLSAVTSLQFCICNYSHSQSSVDTKGDNSHHRI